MHEIKISQLGEGLTEVRVITLLKNQGELVTKDEPLLEVETDKALMVIETPQGGCLQQWLVQEGDTVQVGGVVALIDGEEFPEADVTRTPASRSVKDAIISPGLKARNGALSPRERAGLPAMRDTARRFPLNADPLEISVRQTQLGKLFTESQEYIAEASITMRADWAALVAACRHLKGLEGLEYRPTPPELIAWCCMQAMQEHPRLRALNRGANGYEKQTEICIGNAIALPNDELTSAFIPAASQLDMAAFINAMRRSVLDVRAGRSTVEQCQLLISYMVQHNVWTATPRVMFPAVATLFVGAPYDVPAKATDESLVWKRLSNFVLAFDHRVINGVAAAAFLKSVLHSIESLTEESGA